MICTNCLSDVDSRVEILTPTSRQIVCAECALAIATMAPSSEIRPFAMPMRNEWVAADGYYHRDHLKAWQHQRDIVEAKAARFAERVKRAIAARRQEAA